MLIVCAENVHPSFLPPDVYGPKTTPRQGLLLLRLAKPAPLTHLYTISPAFLIQLYAERCFSVQLYITNTLSFWMRRILASPSQIPVHFSQTFLCLHVCILFINLPPQSGQSLELFGYNSPPLFNLVCRPPSSCLKLQGFPILPKVLFCLYAPNTSNFV